MHDQIRLVLSHEPVPFPEAFTSAVDDMLRGMLIVHKVDVEISANDIRLTAHGWGIR